MDNGIDLEGLDKLVDTLERMGKKGDKILGKAILEGAEIVLQEAKKESPKRTLKGSEALSISNVKTDENGRYVLVGLQKADYKKHFYMSKQEYGYHTRDGKFMSGERFLTNALLKNRKKVFEIIKENIENELMK